MANYEIIEGCRKDSFIYVNGGYTYRMDKAVKGIRYLRCTEFKVGCPGRAKISSDMISITNEHKNHEESETNVEIRKLLTKVKRKAENSQGSLRELFDEEANESEVGGNISFARLENTMYKRRRLNRPQIPLNAEDAISLMQTCNDEFKIYHSFSINGPLPGEMAIGFMSPKWICALQSGGDATLLQADATFFVVPKQFKQLLNIFLEYKSRSLPAVHILMTKKTATLYDRVVEKIKEMVPFTATRIMTDYERALFNSLSSGFPNAAVSGCKFHHDQALYKTGILKNGLATLYTSHQEFRKWAELLMRLPLLPCDKIMEMFNYLKHKKPDLPTSENEKVKKLLRYYERFWLEQIGPSRLSVFQNDKRTNNDLESFHAKLKRKFCSHNPNYWSFITKMNQVIKTTEKDIERIDNNIPIRRNATPEALHKNRVIQDLQRKLIHDEINLINYLETICYQYKTDFMKLGNIVTSTIEQDEIDVISESEDFEIAFNVGEQSNERLCRICFLNEADTLIMPCRHAQTCKSCTEIITISEELNKCPVCRGPIQQFFQIFL